MLRKLLTQRKSALIKIIAECKAKIEKAPPGSLLISTSHGIPYYYQKQPDSVRKLISPSTQSPLIANLARKEYYSKIKHEAESELKAVNKLLSIKNRQTIPKVYENLHPEKKKFVNQCEETREASLEKWLSMPEPDHEPESGKYYIPTKRGELVRSMNEYKIANALFDAGIPYKYEFPYKALNGKTLRPDFYVHNINTDQTYFWEHFGMMNNPQYVLNSFLYKITLYEAGGIILGKNLIATFSGGEYELSEEAISDLIQTYLM